MIRKLLKAGMTFRAISSIAKCSHGSVYAEKVAMRKEAEAQRTKQEEQAKAEQALQETNIIFPEIKRDQEPPHS